jgi:hypothetical protein
MVIYPSAASLPKEVDYYDKSVCVPNTDRRRNGFSATAQFLSTIDCDFVLCVTADYLRLAMYIVFRTYISFILPLPSPFLRNET